MYLFFKLPLSRVVGLSAFNSGQMTTRSTFFHTFDVAGTYFISSEGTDGHLCRVEVLEKGEISLSIKLYIRYSLSRGYQRYSGMKFIASYFTRNVIERPIFCFTYLAAHVGPPGIPAGKKDGGNVSVFKIFSSCPGSIKNTCMRLMKN
mgnify:CR=1 FL=1